MTYSDLTHKLSTIWNSKVTAIIMSALATLIVCIMYYSFVIDNGPPATYFYDEMPILSSLPVAAEESILLEASLCRHSEDLIDVHVLWVNVDDPDNPIKSGMFENLGGKVGCSVLEVAYQLPPELEDGTYYLELVVVSHNNIFNDYIYSIVTEEFTVQN